MLYFGAGRCCSSGSSGGLGHFYDLQLQLHFTELSATSNVAATTVGDGHSQVVVVGGCCTWYTLALSMFALRRWTLLHKTQTVSLHNAGEVYRDSLRSMTFHVACIKSEHDAKQFVICLILPCEMDRGSSLW